MRIGIDIDDTLVSTTKVLKKLWKKYSSDKFPNNIEDLNDSNIARFWSIYRSDITYNNSFKFNAIKVVNKLKQQGNVICIITRRSRERNINLEDNLKKWFNNNNLLFDEIYTDASNKGKLCKDKNIDLLVDDLYENYSLLSEEQKEFLFWYERKMPVGIGNCSMNQICKYVESQLDGYQSQLLLEKYVPMIFQV